MGAGQQLTASFRFTEATLNGQAAGGETVVRAMIPSDLLLRLLRATPEQYAAVERILGCKVERGKPRAKSQEPPAGEVIQRVGRLAYRNDFLDVWLDGEHFDLRRRAKARACLRYLVEQRAFDPDSARDLTREIDPYVRAQCRLPVLPGYGELKIHHYFNPSKSDVARFGRELIRPAGRNGRYYLRVK